MRPGETLAITTYFSNGVLSLGIRILGVHKVEKKSIELKILIPYWY